MLACDAHHLGVEFGHHHALDRRVLEQFLARASVAAADDQRRHRSRMRDRRRVRDRLVVEELVTLGSHVAAVEAEQAAPLRRLEHFERLVGSAHRLDAARGAKAERAVVVEPFEQQLARLRDRVFRSAKNAVGALLARRERDDQVVEQLLGLGRVVGGEVADVDVERHAGALGPGVDRQVRLGQQHGAGDAARLALVVGESEELLVDHGEPGRVDRVAAQPFESRGVSEQCAVALATVKISGEVQSLHSVPTQSLPVAGVDHSADSRLDGCESWIEDPKCPGAPCRAPSGPDRFSPARARLFNQFLSIPLVLIRGDPDQWKAARR